MLALTALLVAPRTAAAQQAGREQGSDLLLRAGAPVMLERGERAGTVVVLGGDAVIHGTVDEQLIVVDGVATLAGRVAGNVLVVGGRLDVGPGGSIGQDVTLVQSEITQAPGAMIAGHVTRSSGMGLGWGAAWMFWASMSLLVLVAGLLFAAVGGRQLAGAAGELATRPGRSMLTALALWIGLPLLATLALVTVVGIPVGLSVLLFVLPALWLLGYLVAGAGVGALLAQARRTIASGDHPYGAVALGLLLLQLLGVVPWIGGALVMLAGLWGAGALALRSWHVLRHRPAGFAPA